MTQVSSNTAYVRRHKSIAGDPLDISRSLPIVDQNFLEAAYDGHIAMVQEHYYSHANINCTDVFSSTALHWAARRGHDDVVDFLLKIKISPRCTSQSMTTPLHWAAYHGYRNISKMLIDHGAIVNAVNSYGSTPLHWAASRDKKETAELLLEAEADLNHTDKRGQSALHLASYEGHETIVKFLLKRGAIKEARTESYRQTPLHYAAITGRPVTTRILLRSGVQTDFQDRSGETALHLAAENGHAATVGVLLEHNASTTITNIRGKTAKEVAIYGNLALKSVFENPPIRGKERSIERSVREMQQEPPQTTLARRSLCSKLNVLVGLYFENSTKGPLFRSVTGIIYDIEMQKLLHGVNEEFLNRNRQRASLSTDPNYSEQPGRSSRPEDSNQDEGRFDTQQPKPIRWIHLPSNNKIWVYDLIDRICADDGKSSQECDTIKQFVEANWYGHKGKTRSSYFRKPSFEKDDQEVMASLVIPFLDTEYHHLCSSSSVIQESLISDDNAQAELMYKLAKEYKDWSILYHSRTLDQSYHTTLDDTSERDSDQVVLRYLKKVSEAKGGEEYEPVPDKPEIESAIKTPYEQINQLQMNQEEQESANSPIQSNNSAVDHPVTQQPVKPRLSRADDVTLTQRPKILLVSQLWLWKIDEHTIITSCPERYHKSSAPTLLNSVLEVQQHISVGNLDNFIEQVIHRCIRFLDDEDFKSGLDEHCFDIFASEIATLAHQVVKRYDDVRDSISERQELLTGENEDLENLKRDIKLEMEWLREVRDIREELHMIQKVVQDQRRVVDMFRLHVSGSGYEVAKDSLVRLTESLTRQIESLDEDAGRAEDSMNHLLDFEQKQANLDEVISAGKRTRVIERQNRILFIFTTVTVIFTPLSFMLSLFALSIKSFKKDEHGQYSAGYIAWNMVTGEIVTMIALLAITCTIWFHNRILKVLMSWYQNIQKAVSSPMASKRPENVIIEASTEYSSEKEAEDIV